MDERLLELLTDLHISVKKFLAECPGCIYKQEPECVCSDMRSRVMAVEVHVQKVIRGDLG
jgi:hypothetical protein